MDERRHNSMDQNRIDKSILRLNKHQHLQNQRIVMQRIQVSMNLTITVSNTWCTLKKKRYLKKLNSTLLKLKANSLIYSYTFWPKEKVFPCGISLSILNRNNNLKSYFPKQKITTNEIRNFLAMTYGLPGLTKSWHY